MRGTSERKRTIPLIMAIIFWPGFTSADLISDGGNDTEIRIGNFMPYTGPLAAFGTTGRAEAAFFEMVNDNGGINGRKVKFISYDDSSNAATAVEQTHKLVETDKVLLMFGSFGTPGNLATRGYLNERRVPQLFVASGDDEWANPKMFPWTMGWQPTFRTEGRIYANYIEAAYPERKIAVLWQNNRFRRDLLQGLQEGLGDLARMIVADTTFDLSDSSSLDAQIQVLKGSGAEILVFGSYTGHCRPSAAENSRTGLAACLPSRQCLGIDSKYVETRRSAECVWRDLDLIPEGCKRPGMEGRSGNEGVVVVHG